MSDHKTNSEIAREINITQALGRIQEYRRNALQHINGMTCNRLPITPKSTDQDAEESMETIKTLLDV